MQELIRSTVTTGKDDRVLGKDFAEAGYSLAELCGAIRDYTMMAAVRSADWIMGPTILPVILLPWTIADALRRVRDYWQFRRLRATLPDSFWLGTGGQTLRAHDRSLAAGSRFLHSV